MKWTETLVLDAVQEHFDSTGPVQMIRQVEVDDRRLDAVVIELAGIRHGIEAKVTRADYRSETDAKRSASERFAHHCWYAAPQGVIDPDSLPERWGLIEVSNGGVSIARPALGEVAMDACGNRVASVALWRAAVAEERQRTPGDPVALAVEIERLQAVLATRDAALGREVERARKAREQMLAALGQEVSCGQCGSAIRYSIAGVWRHVDTSRDRRCASDRAETLRLLREKETGARYGRLEPPPIVPAQLSTDR